VITREALIAEARSWVETPFHAQARLKGVGVDCIGVIVGAARALGLELADERAYPLRPNGTLLRELNRRLERIDALEPACVVAMQWVDEREPHHVALYTGATLIHAYASVRRCVEQPFDAYLADRVRAIYRIPGVG
jgi:cell wall-associated NlpC family hydrolase